MRMPFAKPDPAAEAQTAVDRLEAQRRRLADRLAGGVAAVEAAQRARRDVLMSGDPAPAEMAKLNKACAEAAEARAGVEEAASVIATQLDDAVRHREGLQDAARRALVASEAEARAAALDAAAETLAGAAQVFNDARADLVTALAAHGVRIDNPLATDGVSAVLLARPIVQAALRMAAPSLHEARDGLGVPYDADPVMVMRRAQSGRLRDHAESVQAGTAPAVELPRPGQGSAPVDPNDPFSVKVEMVRGVFREPFAYLVPGGRLIDGSPGSVEVPADVLRVAVEMEIAAQPGTPKAAEILRAVQADAGRPDYIKRRPGAPGTRRIFVDVDNGEMPSPRRASGDVWPDEDREVRRA